jgi:hypothetical protein
MFFSVELFSQGGPGSGPPPPGDGNVDDVSITYLIYPFLVLGAYLGVRFFSTRKP